MLGIDLVEIAEAANLVARARAALEAAEAARDDLIREAYASATMHGAKKLIVKASGLSQARVTQILKRTR